MEEFPVKLTSDYFPKSKLNISSITYCLYFINKSIIVDRYFKTETINGGQNNIYSLNPVCIYVLTIVVITHIKYQLSINNPREEQYKL